MKLEIFMIFTIAVASIVSFGRVVVSAAGDAFDCSPLPDIQTLLDTAFPPWNIDANENRIAGSGGKWNPIYLTKKWNGLDPAKGGYPTDVDTRYPFYYAAAFLGQPGAGGSRHCPKDAPNDHPIHKCPKVTTTSDDGQYGPGHIPPHISLSAVRRGYTAACGTMNGNAIIADWFDFESDTPCDIKKDKLLALVRQYYPRDPVTGAVEYPPPKTPGTPEFYELEFPSKTGSPHYCTDEFIALDQDADFCPYIFEGENRGKYRHPHLALASVQQYLANKLNPTVCGKEWSDYGKYPANPDLSIVFCEMESEEPDAQPVIPYTWPENGERKTKNVPGLFLWTPPPLSRLRRVKKNRRLA